MTTTGKFRSKLEKNTSEALRKNNIKFEYEPFSIQLVEGFVPLFNSWEKIGKTFKDTSTHKIRSINYTPDFVGDNWVMETKGFFRPRDRVIWKLFKMWVNTNKPQWTLFLPQNQKEVLSCIEIIKTL